VSWPNWSAGRIHGAVLVDPPAGPTGGGASWRRCGPRRGEEELEVVDIEYDEQVDEHLR
jgi:hypothetical protein